MPHGFDSSSRPENTNVAEHNAVGDVSTGRRFKGVQLIPQKIQIDTVDADTIYLGYANWGTGDGSALWRIIKISTVSTVMSFSTADGDDKFDNVWSNRLSLSYS